MNRSVFAKIQCRNPVIYVLVFLFQTYKAIIENLPNTNYVTVIISAICMVILYIVKVQINQRFKHKLKVPVPIELLVVSTIFLDFLIVRILRVSIVQHFYISRNFSLNMALYLVPKLIKFILF